MDFHEINEIKKPQSKQKNSEFSKLILDESTWMKVHFDLSDKSAHTSEISFTTCCAIFHRVIFIFHGKFIYFFKCINKLMCDKCFRNIFLILSQYLNVIWLWGDPLFCTVGFWYVVADLQSFMKINKRYDNLDEKSSSFLTKIIKIFPQSIHQEKF
jgi:hypothetical protein